MATIKVSLNHPIWNGEEIIFKASCNSEAADGMEITYPLNEDGTLETKTYSFRDAHGNNLSNTANVFVSGSYVQVIVDTAKSFAYIQNADTNGYLEGKLATPIYTGTISTTWNGSAAPFSQDVTITGLLAGDNPIVDLVPSSTYATAAKEIEAYGKIYRMVTAANTLTVYATEKTTTALNIQLAVLR